MPAIHINGTDHELRLTMHRVRLMSEYTGIDMLNVSGAEARKHLASIGGMTGALYALVGGPKSGMTRDEFEDAIPLHEMAGLADLIRQVFERDGAPPEPKADGGEGNAVGDASTSTKSKPDGAST